MLGIEEVDVCDLSSIDKDDLSEIQYKIGKNITFTPIEIDRGLIAGFDSHYCQKSDINVATICIFDLTEKELIYSKTLTIEKSGPYKPGYLVLRELPLFLQVWNKIPVKYEPDCVVLDGNGILHPRRCGFATHVSICIEKPTFGIAKSLIGGEYEELRPKKGSYQSITYHGETRGVALRTRDSTNPVFVSVGNDIQLSDCISLTLDFAKYRIPELTRQPDILSRKKCKSS